jgi:pimeloyl-ACP methyl ester carboxylesterase
MKALFKIILVSLLFYADHFTANAQVSSINSAVITPRVWNDYPSATGTYINNYASSITLGESGEYGSFGFANRDFWQFSNNGGVSPYTLAANDYFTASFTLNVTGATTVDNESGWIIPNANGLFPAGDMQFIADPQSGFLGFFGGPGYWNSGLTYTAGEMVTMGMRYFYDTPNSENALQFWVNAGSGNVYSPVEDWSGNLAGDDLGAYFQLQGTKSSPGSSGQAVFQNINISAPPTIIVDGTLDSAYGNPLAVQTINTGFGNSTIGDGTSAGGSELDAAYGRVIGGNLYLFIAGNFEDNGNHVNIFISDGRAGQNTLAIQNTGVLQAMNGSVFSPGFQATYAIDLNDYAGTAYLEEYRLTGTPSGGYVGAIPLTGGIGTGSPDGSIQYGINDTHVSTMGAGNAALSGATSGANATTGLELCIPLSLLGNPTGNILVMVDINGSGDTYLSNQFLPGLTVGTANLGGGGLYGPGGGVFNFGSTPGQYFVVSVSNQSPSIFSQTASQTVPVVSNVTFGVTAMGTWPLNYQWQFNGQNIAGQTAASLSLTNVQFANAGGYSVMVTNTYGSVTSAVAQLTVFTNLVVTQTNKAPPLPGNPTIPTDATHFKVFTNGGFVTGIGLDTNKSTIVLTHGWNESSSIWPLDMANNIKVELGSSTPNIVAWDWTTEATNNLPVATLLTQGQGYALGENLTNALGANYSQRIHFIGHSLGTLVNARAANFIHTNGFSWINTQMTLLDEAEVAWAFVGNGWKILPTLLQNDSAPQRDWKQPLPDKCAWADNYITAVGMPHAQAVNVILTNWFPDLSDIGQVLYASTLTWTVPFKDADTDYHNYSYVWYNNTVNQINNPNDPPYLMGFVRSWEGGGYAGRPSKNFYYIESTNCPAYFLSFSGYDPHYNLIQINSDQANQFLNARPQNLISQVGVNLVSVGVNLVSSSDNILANAPSQAQALLQSGQIWNPFASVPFLLQYDKATVVKLVTTSLINGLVRPMGGPVPLGGSGGNSPAYVWIPVTVPSNALTMAFNFMLQGNGNHDSFQVAMNSNNLMTVETVLIQTNVTMSSGMIDVSQYAGQQAELFFGIVGGTSTNASVTVSDIAFYVTLPPSLQIQMAGTNVVLSWPLWAATYSLETTGTLWTTNSWMVVTNAPSIVNSQCTVTNQISGKSSYYRLAIITAPILQAQVSGNSFILSWPASAQNFGLQTTTNLADPNSWMTVTNTPATVNLQCLVTNQISGAARFYRLKR